MTGEEAATVRVFSMDSADGTICRVELTFGEDDAEAAGPLPPRCCEDIECWSPLLAVFECGVSLRRNIAIFLALAASACPSSPSTAPEQSSSAAAAHQSERAPARTSASAGIGIEELLSKARRADTTALVLQVHGEERGVWWFEHEPAPIESMSVTKSIVGLAVGIAIEQGHLQGVDVPVVRYFPAFGTNPQRKSVTLRHLLTHTSGLPQNPKDWSRPLLEQALAAPLEHAPGEKFQYSNLAMSLIGGILTEATKQDLDVFVGKYLFEPLGITEYSWHKPFGRAQAQAGLSIRPEDLAKIGELLRNGGKHDGTQLVSADWVSASTRPQAPGGQYGYLWWLLLDPHAKPIGYYADGFLGQRLVVIPERGIVAVRMRRMGEADRPGETADPATNYAEFAQHLTRLEL